MGLSEVPAISRQCSYATKQREAWTQKYKIIYNSAYAYSNDKNPKTDILKEGEQPHLTPLKVTTEHDSRYFSSS